MLSQKASGVNRRAELELKSKERRSLDRLQSPVVGHRVVAPHGLNVNCNSGERPRSIACKPED